ncbi:MAG: acyl carrier protein [Anaerolineae bacterium]|nr:acyl carrier protein [Anaerolineae bacterium]
MAEPMTFDQFRLRLAELLDLRPEQLAPEASFIADLGIDSLRMVDTVLQLQEEGFEVSPDLAWQMRTVGDAYRLYRERVDAQGP